MASPELSRSRSAALPIYRIGPADPATDRFWGGVAPILRRPGIDGVPSRLSTPRDPVGFAAAPSLLVTQTCGYPLTTRLRGRVRVIATPTYSVEGFEGTGYRSAIVVRVGDGRRSLDAFRGATAAINNRDSHSGMNAFRATVAPLALEGSLGRSRRRGATSAAFVPSVGERQTSPRSTACRCGWRGRPIRTSSVLSASCSGRRRRRRFLL